MAGLPFFITLTGASPQVPNYAQVNPTTIATSGATPEGFNLANIITALQSPVTGPGVQLPTIPTGIPQYVGGTPQPMSIAPTAGAPSKLWLWLLLGAGVLLILKRRR